MLPSSQRLSTTQFNAVINKGRATHSSLFVIRALKVTESTRLSATISTKIGKKATERTTMRRKIYNFAQPIFPLLTPNTHIIVFAKKEALSATDENLSKDLQAVFVKAGLMK